MGRKPIYDNAHLLKFHWQQVTSSHNKNWNPFSPYLIFLSHWKQQGDPLTLLTNAGASVGLHHPHVDSILSLNIYIVTTMISTTYDNNIILLLY